MNINTAQAGARMQLAPDPSSLLRKTGILDEQHQLQFTRLRAVFQA